jgi:hypothetical protein
MSVWNLVPILEALDPSMIEEMLLTRTGCTISVLQVICAAVICALASLETWVSL